MTGPLSKEGGSCQLYVFFDTFGMSERVEVSRSSGSPDLDNYFAEFARKNWTVRPNTDVHVTCSHRLHQQSRAAISDDFRLHLLRANFGA